MSRTSPGRQPSPPSTKPRRRTTQLSRANTRPTSPCTTRSRGMTGSLGPCGQRPRSARRSWARPAGRALRPEAARRCPPHRPCVCTPWPTGLRYESRCRQAGHGGISSVQVPWGPRQPSLNCLADEPACSSFTGDEGRWLLEEEGDIQP